MSAVISDIIKGSIADKKGICAGDKLISIDGHEICDVLDYKFYSTQEKLSVEIETPDRQRKTLFIKKGEYDDLGLVFDTYLMDKHKSCQNRCIFCFIDQLPRGMRKTLYFKDDDARLSFLLGNYITLTNLSDSDIDRIIRLRISPINISVHAMEPELRAAIMRNPKAANLPQIIKRLADAKIIMNCQIVLMKGINDGEHLDYSMRELAKLYPYVASLSIVPVGLTKYRDGLYELEPFDAESAAQVIRQVEAFGERCLAEKGTRLVYLADEFYIKAGIELPDYEYYEDFPQLENGVGLAALFLFEARQALESMEPLPKSRHVSVATGEAAAPIITGLVDEIRKRWYNLQCTVYPIRNDFFGQSVTVAGLLTGKDLLAQLKGLDLGQELLIPASMLCHDGKTFLDDMTVDMLSQMLNVKVTPVKVEGAEFVKALCNETGWKE